MAVSEMTNAKLRLVFYDGDNEETGKPIYKGKNFNIRFNATAEQLYETAEAFASLQERPLYNVVRNDSSEIKA